MLDGMAKISKVVKRVKENYGATFTFTQQVRDEIISRCNNIASGARMIDAIISNDLLPEISSKFLEKTMDNRKILSVTVDSKDGEFIYNFEDVEAEQFY